MASTIQIKRGTGSAVPSGLADGELAINLDSGQLYFGSGSTSVNSFRFTNLTADNYTVSSSVTNYVFQTLSGSSDFGDDVGDIHNRTGSLNISGALNVVGNIAGTLSTAAQPNITSVGTLTNLVVDNVQINSNAINSTSDTDVFISMGTAGFGFEANNGDKFEFNSAQNNVDFQYNGENDGTLLYIDASADKVGIGTSTPGEKLEVIGNISASGNVYGDRIYAGPLIFGTSPSADKIRIGFDSSLQFLEYGKNASTSHYFEGNITASGNISASGTILGGPIIGRDYVEFGNTSGNRIEPVNSTQYDLKIGNVSKVNVYSTLVRTTTPFQVGVDSGDYLRVLGNITASGNISASSAVLTGHITASGNISASSAVLTGNVTASGNISSSGGIYGTTLLINDYNTANSTGTTLRLGYDSSLTALAYGKDSDTHHFFYGSITASGDISASSAILTGNLDVDGTTNLDAVDIDGNVQLDGTFTVGVDDTGYDVTLFGATSLRKAVWDASQDHLKLYDNTKLVLGAGPAAVAFDASLYHDGTDLNLTNTTGEFKISTDTVRITAGTAGDANLILQSDTDDSEEADNPFMLFEQDGGGIRSYIGHAGADDQYPDATTFTGGKSNHLIIAHSGSSGATRGLQLGTGNNARVTINVDGEVGIGTNNPGKTLDVTGEIRASSTVTATSLAVNTTGDSQANIISSQQADLRITTTHASTNRDVGIELSGSGAQYSLALDRANDTFVIANDTVDNAPGNAKLTLNASGDLSTEGTIKAGWHGSTTRIKILVSDFIPDDIGRPAMIDDTGSDRWLESHGTGKLFASLPIPTGFKATHVHIYGSGTSALEVSEMNINSKTVTSKGTGNIGTELDITDVTSTATNYLLLELAQASGEEVYGGYVTIEAV